MKLRALRYTLLFSILFGITFLLRASLPSVATGTWVAAIWRLRAAARARRF